MQTVLVTTIMTAKPRELSVIERQLSDYISRFKIKKLFKNKIILKS